MENTRIQNGQSERILATALDANGDFVISLADVLLEIRRKSDSYYYDFDDNTFKNSGWVTKQEVMAELDATNSPGTYFYNFDTSGLSDDEYYIRVTSVTAANSPWEGELKVGDFIDYIDASINDVKLKTDNLPVDPTSETNATSNKNEIISEIDDNETKIDNIDTSTESEARFTEIKGAGWTVETLKAIYDAILSSGIKDWTEAELKQIRSALGIDGLKITATSGQLQDIKTQTDKIPRILGLVQENFRTTDIVYDSNHLLTSATIKIFANASDCENNINPIATYGVTAVYNSEGETTSYKVIKN